MYRVDGTESRPSASGHHPCHGSSGQCRVCERRSSHHRRTARRSRPSETTAAHRRPPAWRPGTAASWAKEACHDSVVVAYMLTKLSVESRGLRVRRPELMSCEGVKIVNTLNAQR